MGSSLPFDPRPRARLYAGVTRPFAWASTLRVLEEPAQRLRRQRRWAQWATNARGARVTDGGASPRTSPRGARTTSPLGGGCFPARQSEALTDGLTASRKSTVTAWQPRGPDDGRQTVWLMTGERAQARRVRGVGVARGRRRRASLQTRRNYVVGVVQDLSGVPGAARLALGAVTLEASNDAARSVRLMRWTSG